MTQNGNYVTKKIRINNNAIIMHNVKGWRKRNFGGVPDVDNRYFRENAYEEILDGKKIYRRSFIVELKENDPDYIYGNDPLVIQDLVDDGWNVKVSAPREEGDSPRFFLTVNVKFKTEEELEAEKQMEERGEEVRYRRTDPKIRLKVGDNETDLDKHNVGDLDDLYIDNARVLINPYNNRNGGVTAYLSALQVEASALRSSNDDVDDFFE